MAKFKSNIADYKEEKIKDKNRFFRKVENYKYDTSRKVNRGISTVIKGAGTAGINFLNILPHLGKTVASFFGNLFTDVFNSIYNQQIDQKSARNVIIGFFVVVGFTTVIVTGLINIKILIFLIKKEEIVKPETKIKEVKKPEIKVKKEVKKPEIKVKKEVKKPEIKKLKSQK